MITATPQLFPCSGRYAGYDVLSRREMLRKSAGGLGGIALSWLMAQSRRAQAAEALAMNLLPKPPQFPVKAKRMIFLYMGGGPSHLDLLDPKPMLTKYDGQRIPFNVEQRDVHSAAKVLASPFSFKKYGQSGLDVSELLPHLSTVVDDLAVVRSGVSTRIDHGEALLMMHTGRPISGFPTLGSWLTYGLGTESANLPAYVAMPEGPSERVRNATSSGWLPALYQGTPMNTGDGDPFFFLNPPKEAAHPDRNPADFLRLTKALNERHQAARAGLTELDARIQNFELAARMQVEAMKQMDLSAESPATRKLYGLDDKTTGPFGKRCLLARRLIEAGVRFVHVMRNDWDHHTGLRSGLTNVCAATDQPIAGLLKDLKGRGLLHETLVVWTGEFGRLPVVEGSDGRDHNPFGFSFWMAGGGVKAGTIYGSTDDFGYKAAENPVRVADLHATILHLLGLHHEELTYQFEGRAETITGVEAARVVSELVA